MQHCKYVNIIEKTIIASFFFPHDVAALWKVTLKKNHVIHPLITIYSVVEENAASTHPEHGVGVGVVVGQVADVQAVREADGEGGGVVSLALHSPCGLGGAQEVVAVVADVLTHSPPPPATFHGLCDGEHHWLHACEGKKTTFTIFLDYLQNTLAHSIN